MRVSSIPTNDPAPKLRGKTVNNFFSLRAARKGGSFCVGRTALPYPAPHRLGVASRYARLKARLRFLEHPDLRIIIVIQVQVTGALLLTVRYGFVFIVSVNSLGVIMVFSCGILFSFFRFFPDSSYFFVDFFHRSFIGSVFYGLLPY